MKLTKCCPRLRWREEAWALSPLALFCIIAGRACALLEIESRQAETCPAKTSVHFPNSRCSEFHKVIVGITEIKALSTGRPVYFALDRDAPRDQVLFPGGVILFRDC